MRKTMAMVTVLLMGAGFMGTSLAAQRGGHGMNIPSERRLSRILDLTDEQNEKVNSLREAARASVRALRDERRERQRQLKATLDMDTPDPLRVGELVLANRDGRKKMRALYESNRESFRAILTEEQLTKLEERKDRRGSRRGFRRGSRRN